MIEQIFNQRLISVAQETKGKKNTKYTLTGDHIFTLPLTRKNQVIYVFAKSNKLKGSQRRELTINQVGQDISFTISPQVIKNLFQVKTSMVPFPICLDFGNHSSINFRVRKTKIYKKK